MGFKSGHEKLGGRQKGSQNQVTADVRSVITSIVGDRMGRVNQALDSMDDDRFLDFIIRLMKMIMPKNVTVKTEGGYMVRLYDSKTGLPIQDTGSDIERPEVTLYLPDNGREDKT